MNEAMIAIIVVIIIAVLTAVWIITESAKKSAHARIERSEHATDELARESITTKAFDRMETNINNRLDGIQDHINTTNKRIDDLVLAINTNGGIK